MIQRFVEPHLQRLAAQFPVITITEPRQSGSGEFCQYGRGYTEINSAENFFQLKLYVRLLSTLKIVVPETFEQKTKKYLIFK